jgi:GNAT superfamily N-acetyltransferase
MLKRILLKLKTPDDNPISALLKSIYFNVFRINTFILYGLNLQQEIDFTQLQTMGDNAKIITHHELKAYTASERNLPREFYMNAIDGVEHCGVILQDGKIACICWLYFRQHPNRWYLLGRHEAILNYVYTFPEYRGKGYFPIALLKCVQWLQERNYTRVIIPVHSETLYMIRSLRKVAEVEKVGAVRHWFLLRPKFAPNGSQRN